MHTFRRQATRQWLIRLLACLLLLAPYLHGHVGASAQSGLHLAGMHSLASDHEGPDEESLAVGIAPSVPQMGLDLLGLVACAPLAWLCLRSRQASRPPRPERRPPPATLYALGWPPPSLAPPRA